MEQPPCFKLTEKWIPNWKVYFPRSIYKSKHSIFPNFISFSDLNRTLKLVFKSSFGWILHAMEFLGFKSSISVWFLHRNSTNRIKSVNLISNNERQTIYRDRLTNNTPIDNLLWPIDCCSQISRCMDVYRELNGLQYSTIVCTLQAI